MQFKFVERGSDKRDGLLKARHRTNRAHPLFCVVSLSPEFHPSLILTHPAALWSSQINLWSEP